MTADTARILTEINDAVAATAAAAVDQLHLNGKCPQRCSLFARIAICSNH